MCTQFDNECQSNENVDRELAESSLQNIHNGEKKERVDPKMAFCQSHFTITSEFFFLFIRPA